MKLFVLFSFLAFFSKSALSQENAHLLVKHRVKKSQSSWTALSDIASQYSGLNDDGSIQIDWPSQTKKNTFFRTSYLSSNGSDLDSLCRYFIKKADPSEKFQSEVYANRTSLKSSGYLVSWLGIPFVPETYSTSHYIEFLESLHGHNPQKVSINGESVAQIACYAGPQEAPLSENYESIEFSNDSGQATISKPQFVWMRGLNIKPRFLSATNNPHTVCNHFGFDFAVEGSVKTAKSSFRSSVLLDKNRHVTGVFSANSELGQYIKQISCGIDFSSIKG